MRTDLSADFIVVQVNERFDLVADSSSVQYAEVRLQVDLHLLRCIDEHHREPDAVVDVVATTAPPPTVVAEASRDSRHVSDRTLTAAAGSTRVHIARTVCKVASAASGRDGMDDTC